MNSNLLMVPPAYKSKLNLLETERAIKRIKDYFEKDLAERLNLTRVSAPLYVMADLGLNDNLSGSERPVSFDVKGLDYRRVEIVHSLAKWKRVALKNYDFHNDTGIYTDMNTIRRDENLDNLHSIYVDQWDWERILRKEARNQETLQKIVRDIFMIFKDTENHLHEVYPQLERLLPDEITFITSEELLQMYPDKTAKERENLIAEKHKAVFVSQIGGRLSNGEAHDSRAPDYDDWSLNGDILFWYPLLGCAFEVSSMGVRVDETALAAQLEQSAALDRLTLPYHKSLLNGELPDTIGGGIGQSRICMFFLNKAHISEVQASVWPEEMLRQCKEKGIVLL